MAVRFDKKLVLNKWIFSRFGTKNFEVFKALLYSDSLVGFNEEGNSLYLSRLKELPLEKRAVDDDMLQSYDENIVKYWKLITRKRNSSGKSLFPLYFQYLALIFTEYYLDRFFYDKTSLLDDLNGFLKTFNEENEFKKADLVEPFVANDLNKLAYWIATGGGKTLLMHVNVMQFKFYMNKHNRHSDFNRVILLTPNEGLSRQHYKEFQKSGVSAEIFKPGNQSSFFQPDVEIIDIHKLKEKKGENTVAIESFESNNLVLVDEGHRGASGDDWLAKRNQICENGFSFEYSATFGQSIKAAPKNKQKTLTQLYSKCIISDYSYRYFHEDGYGKDHSILNLEEEKLNSQRQLYLTACLLGFFEQKTYYKNSKADLTSYLLENPLWIFVGGSVVGGKDNKELSDVQQIIYFISEFLANKNNETVKNLQKLLSRKDDLRGKDQKPVFSNIFHYLIERYSSDKAEDIYKDILSEVFNSESRGTLHVVNLKGTSGEIGLRVGGADFFGVINVGDPGGLVKKCEEEITGGTVVVTEQTFSSSLFHGINAKDSKINLLVGAKKFSEGWSSWRVSTMGLMNIGKTEGSEIIQLFGRGIRLRGYNFTLRRSGFVDLSDGKHPEQISIMETLNIFGVKSNYMEEFENFLKEEGVDNEEKETVVLPVVLNDLPADLQIVRTDEDMPSFKKNKRLKLPLPPEDFPGKVIVDWYPKIRSKRSKSAMRLETSDSLFEGKLGKRQLSFLDYDKLFFDLQRFKSEKSRHNIEIDKGMLRKILEVKDWYILFIPEYNLKGDSFQQLEDWQEIALTLLKKYLEKYFSYEKSKYEKPFLKYNKLKKDDPNFIKQYRATIDKSRTDWVSKVKEFASILSSEEGQKSVGYEMEFGSLKVFDFEKHLYKPIVKLNNNEVIKISPVSMNEGEYSFVEDLKNFCGTGPKILKDCELYLLRNQSKKGVGFFLEGNFYPDFILWVKAKGKQYVNFIDPKGLRNIKGFEDPKISFCKRIKEIEMMLGNSDIVLNSFIVSNTPESEISWWAKGDESSKAFGENHVLFQDDEKYVEQVFRVIEAE